MKRMRRLFECAVTMYSNLGFFASNPVNHSFAGYQKLIALSKLDRLVSLFKSQNPKINNGHAMLMRLLLQYFTVLLRQENNFYFCTCNDYQLCQCSICIISVMMYWTRNINKYSVERMKEMCSHTRSSLLGIM